MSIKFNKMIFLLLSVIFIIRCSNTARNDKEILASVEERAIDISSFITRYKDIRTRFGLPDNGQVRKNVLQSMLDEETLIVEAINRGYDNDREGRYQLERVQIQTMLNIYHDKFIASRIEVHEDELKALFVRLNTKIKARHLYTPTRIQADSLYAELLNGKSFELLAKEVFEDPRLRDSGGSLDYFSVDDMDPAFEDAAFMLEIGRISKPVRTVRGYSIIQLEDRITKPLLTESEYTKHRDKLESYWRYRKNKKETQAYVDSLRRYLQIEFNPHTVKKLWTYLNNRKKYDFIEKDDMIFKNDEIKNSELVRSRAGVWDIKTFRKHVKFTSEDQLKFVRNKENLEDFMAGLVVRAYMLSRAKDLGLHKSHAYEIRIKQNMDEYLLKRMEQNVFEAATIPEDTLRTYFQQNQDQFFTPPQIQLSEIVLNNESKAKEIKSMLLNKVSFEELAREHSVRRWSADKDGDIGTFTYKELGSYADRLMPLEIGRWIGPIIIGYQYAFFKCIGKYPKRAQTFDEACSEIEKGFRSTWYKKTKQDMLEAIRTHVKIVTYPEKLKSIQLIR